MPRIAELLRHSKISDDVDDGRTDTDTADSIHLGSMGQQLIFVYPYHGQNALIVFGPGYGIEVLFGIKTAASFGDDEYDCVTYGRSVKLNLVHYPCFPVESIAADPSGRTIVLAGTRGIVLVSIPKDIWSRCSVGAAGLMDEYLCRCDAIDEKLFSSNPSLRCLRLRWHPCAAEKANLFALFSDNCLRLYHTEDFDYPVMKILVGSDGTDSLSKISFTDAAVSFDFGDAIDNDDVNGNILWPIYILLESGYVYSVLIDLKAYRHLDVVGPLTVCPQVEDNYGIDSTDLLYLSGPVPVLVIATSYGVLYHCIVLEEKCMFSEVNEGNGKCCLYVFESVELEMNLAVTDLKTGEQLDDSNSSVIRLYKDPQLCTRFFCVHSSGVHSVNLGWVLDLATMGKNSSDSDHVCAYNSACVDYILCIKPSCIPSSPSASEVKCRRGIKGFAVFGGIEQSSFILVALDDWVIVAAPVRWLSESRFSNWKEAGGAFLCDAELGNKEQDYFIDKIKRILHRSASVPLLKSQNKELSEKDSGQLMMRAIEVLKSEYLNKLEIAREMCFSRIVVLVKQRKNIDNELAGVKKRIETVSSRLSSVTEKCIALTENQQRLSDRIFVLCNILQRSSGSLSHAEERLLEKLLVLQSAFGVARERLKKTQAMVKIGGKEKPKNVSTIVSFPRSVQLWGVKKILEEHNDELERLVSAVRTIRSGHYDFS